LLPSPFSKPSEYRYNPLNNDLDAYALAFNIASLLNNLFGRGKEPFWQQAYTNLVKFIILLHKIAYDYVTLFNVYECAISPPLLEQRIREAEEIIMGRHFAAVTPEVFGKRPVELAGLGFKHDPGKERYLAEASKELWDELHAGGIAAEPITILDAKFADPDKLEQLYAVQRWFREGSRSRTKEQIREVRHTYLDLDEEAGASLQAIRTSGDVPPPNFVLDTSPGKHQVVWRVEGLDTNQAETLLRALASQYGGDPAATDISRLLRLPGFANRKYNEAFVVRVHHETDALYHGQDFHVQEDSPESPRRLGDSQNSSRRTSTGHRSQSEADWAYAKRALARGDNTEQIIQRIADYRADDKADPYYYARLTVIKAQLALMSPEQGRVVAPESISLTGRDH
jgi:hypothetical protein